MHTHVVTLDELRLYDFILAYRVKGGTWVDVHSTVNNIAAHTRQQYAMVQTTNGRIIYLQLHSTDEFEILNRPGRK